MIADRGWSDGFLNRASIGDTNLWITRYSFEAPVLRTQSTSRCAAARVAPAEITPATIAAATGCPAR